MDQQLDFRCSVHADPFECADALITYSPALDEYGIIIHDGGSSSIGIQFCPWCATQLPPSRRDAWHAALEALGINPWTDDVPAEFQTDAWYGSTGPSRQRPSR